MLGVEPRPISGFKEFLPEEQIELERMKQVIARTFELFGFAPIETAAAEREDVLLAKAGENTKLIYGLHLLERADQDIGDSRDIALRFDLTVPLARYVAQNYGKLDFPFRRYQMQKVWRGERAQKGWFREFYQCDIDIVGDGELGLLSDAEIPAVIDKVFTELAFGQFQILLNNRRILNGLLDYLNIPMVYRSKEDSKEQYTMNIIDKTEKIGIERTKELLCERAGATNAQVDALMEILTFEDETDRTVQWLQKKEYGDLFSQGVSELAEVMQLVRAQGVPEERCRVDLGIARGLDYYTGTVYETILINNPEIGSVCSGGRYDDLAGRFIDRKLPGVGISIGLTRLLAVLLESKVVEAKARTPSQVIIFNMSPKLRSDYFALATKLREAAIPTEVYPEDRKMEKQTKYAVKKGVRFGVFLDEERKRKNSCTVRNFRSDTEQNVPIADLSKYL